MTKQHSHYDVIIIGGGLVGGSLALLLKDCPIKIALVDAAPVDTRLAPDKDARTLALTRSSLQALKNLKIFSKIQSKITPIRHIHVSEKGRFGVARMDAAEVGVDSLGAVIPIQQLQSALYEAMNNQSNLDIHCPARVEQLDSSQEPVRVTLQKNQETIELTASLVIAADGVQSHCRSLLDIKPFVKDYQQRAIVCNVQLQHPAKKLVAYERFMQDKILALLPVAPDRYGCIYVVSPDEVDDTLALTSAEFSRVIQQHFGYRLGRFVDVGQRFSYPIKLLYCEQQYRDRVVLMGNAAHSLHPIAGQGYNLALRDCCALAELIQKDLNDPALLQNYMEWRSPDQKRAVKFTDNLISVFTHDFTLLRWFRHLGLLAFDRLPQLKHYFARRGMGYYGRSSQWLT